MTRIRATLGKTDMRAARETIGCGIFTAGIVLFIVGICIHQTMTTLIGLALMFLSVFIIPAPKAASQQVEDSLTVREAFNLHNTATLTFAGVLILAGAVALILWYTTGNPSMTSIAGICLLSGILFTVLAFSRRPVNLNSNRGFNKAAQDKGITVLPGRPWFYRNQLRFTGVDRDGRRNLYEYDPETRRIRFIRPLGKEEK